MKKSLIITGITNWSWIVCCQFFSGFSTSFSQKPFTKCLNPDTTRDEDLIFRLVVSEPSGGMRVFVISVKRNVHIAVLFVVIIEEPFTYSSSLVNSILCLRSYTKEFGVLSIRRISICRIPIIGLGLGLGWGSGLRFGELKFGELKRNQEFMTVVLVSSHSEKKLSWGGRIDCVGDFSVNGRPF